MTLTQVRLKHLRYELVRNNTPTPPVPHPTRHPPSHAILLLLRPQPSPSGNPRASSPSRKKVRRNSGQLMQPSPSLSNAWIAAPSSGGVSLIANACFRVCGRRGGSELGQRPALRYLAKRLVSPKYAEYRHRPQLCHSVWSVGLGLRRKVGERWNGRSRS